MKSFLDAQYVHLLQILRLIITKQPDVSVSVLSEELELATGTINGLIKQLSSDLEPYSLSFDKNDTGQINLIDEQHHQAVKTAYSNTVYQQLMITYLADSKVFNMLLDILDAGGIDRLAFCNKMFISQATFSRYRTRLIKLLNSYSLGLNSQNVIIGDETQIVVFLAALLTESGYANYLAQTDQDFQAVSRFVNSEPLVKNEIDNLDRYQFDVFTYVLYKRRHFSQPTKLPDISSYLTGPMTDLAEFTNDFSRWANLKPKITGNLMTFFLYRIATLKIAPGQFEPLLFEVVGTDAIFLQLCYQSLRDIPEYSAFTVSHSQEETAYSQTIRDELIRLLVVCKFGFTNSHNFHLLDQSEIPLYTTSEEADLYGRVKQVVTRCFCELSNANWSQQIDYFSRSIYLLMSSLKSDYALAKQPPRVTIFIQHANNNELVHLIQNKLQLVFGKEKVAFIESVDKADIVIVNNVVDLVSEAQMKDPESLLNDRRLHLYSLAGLTNSSYFNKLINDLSTTLLSRVS